MAWGPGHNVENESGFLSDDDQQALEAFVADLDAFVAELEDSE